MYNDEFWWLIEPFFGVMLGQRRRWWANIKPALGQRLLFAGISSSI